jgi:hypothetical protein
MWGIKMFWNLPKTQANIALKIPMSTRPPKLPISEERIKSIKTLLHITSDLQEDCGLFDFLVGYDFNNLQSDIAMGEQRRKAESDSPM